MLKAKRNCPEMQSTPIADVIGKLEKQSQMGDFHKTQIAPCVPCVNGQARACMLEGNQRCKDGWADSVMAVQAAHHQQMLHTYVMVCSVVAKANPSRRPMRDGGKFVATAITPMMMTGAVSPSSL